MDNNREENKRKKGAVDRLSDTYRAGRNAQKTVRLVIQLVKKAIQAIRYFANPYFGVFALIIVFVIIILLLEGDGLPLQGGSGSDNNQDETTAGAPQFPPIPGLSLDLSGPNIVNNGQSISYKVSIIYDADAASVPIENITIFHLISEQTNFLGTDGIYTQDSSQRLISWPLTESSNQDGFSFTVSPNTSDFFLDVRVYAQAAPPASGNVGGVCSEGSGFCSTQNLMSYFGDEATARQAAIICNRESGSNPGALNDGCLDGSSLDYSVGLFQINLLAHCAGAFSHNNNPRAPSCTILNQAALDACYNRFSDPVQNINYAKTLYSSSGWGPWSAANACGIDI